MSLLESRSVDTSLVQRVSGAPTRDVLVTRTADGERTFAGFGAAEVDGYADCFMDASSLPLSEFRDAFIVVTGTLWLAFPKAGAAARAAARAAAEGGKAVVVVDVNWRPVFWAKYRAHGGEEAPESAADAAPSSAPRLTSHGHHVPDEHAAARRAILEYVEVADVLKVTDEEAEFLFGIPAAEALETPGAVLAAAPAKTKAVLISAGEKGSAYAFRASGEARVGDDDAETQAAYVIGHVPLFPVKVSDTTGAGDSYLAGFLSKLVEAGSLKALASDPAKARAALTFASACGAFTCMGSGAIAPQPTIADAQKILAEHA